MRLKSLLRCRPSPALAISLVALFVSLGGASYAAIRIPNNSVGTAQLRHGAVTNSKIRAEAVTFGKIRPNAVGRVRANLTQIQARVSQSCATGTAIGALSQQGMPTCNNTLPPQRGTSDTSETVGATATTLNSMSLASGSWLAFANPSVTVSNVTGNVTVTVTCRLAVGSNTQDRSVTIPGGITVSIPLQLAGGSGTASVSCQHSGGGTAPVVHVTSALDALQTGGNS